MDVKIQTLICGSENKYLFTNRYDNNDAKSEHEMDLNTNAIDSDVDNGTFNDSNSNNSRKRNIRCVNVSDDDTSNNQCDKGYNLRSKKRRLTSK